MIKKTLFLVAIAAILPLCQADARKTNVTNVRWCSFNVRVNAKIDVERGASWETRRDRVCQWVKDNHVDVVGFQEVQTSMLPDIIERLPEYAYVAQGRLNKEKGDEMVPVFYRKDKYELIDSGTFWLSETPDSKGSKGWDAVVPRIATWVKLKDVATGKVFLALSTHFDHKGKQARVESGKLLAAMMPKIAGKAPAMLAGDFNMSDTSPGYAAIVGNPYVIRDAYFMSPHHTGVRYTYQAFSSLPDDKPKPRGDFIFVSKQIQVTATHFEPDIPTLPLSDHNPIWADLMF